MPAPAIVPGDGPARVDMLVLSGVLGITIGDVVWLHALKLLGARRLILVDSVKPFVGTDSQKYSAW
jgi:drug/metabolite transporter (DMT)-like permease